MGTKQQNADHRATNIAKLEAQLKDWTTQLDGLVGDYLRAGSQTHDAYHIRINTLRVHQEAVQAKLDEFNSRSDGGGPWGTFLASTADDWKALEEGFKDLTH